MKKRSVQFKLTAGLILMALVLAVALTVVVANLYRARMEEYYSDIAYNQACIAAEHIDGDTIEKYYKTGEKDEYYEEIRQYLEMSAEKINAQYFYVVVPEKDVMVYIWDTGEESGVCELGDVDAYYGDGDRMMHAAFQKNAPKEILITNNEEYGYLASAYVAILDSDSNPVALSSVDVSMNMINHHIRLFVLVSLLVTLLVLVLSCICYFFYIRKTVLVPTNTLKNATVSLMENKLEDLQNFNVDIQSGDEFESLAGSFTYMAHQLSDYVRNLSLITAEKERIGAP